MKPSRWRDVLKQPLLVALGFLFYCEYLHYFVVLWQVSARNDNQNITQINGPGDITILFQKKQYFTTFRFSLSQLCSSQVIRGNFDLANAGTYLKQSTKSMVFEISVVF
jgi:hypothetical protein